MKIRYLLILPVVALTLLAYATVGRNGQTDAPVRYGLGRQVGVLANKEITESSGVAVSRRVKNTWWTHNDSGAPAEIFAFAADGRHLGTFLIRGVKAVDWEDMASFAVAGESYLLIADIGDNDEKRTSCTLYIVTEPSAQTPAQPQAEAKMVSRIHFRYEDGPHDCEAVAVDLGERSIYLITKSRRPDARVFRLPLLMARAPDATAPGKAGQPITAKLIAKIPLANVTGMDMSPDGRRAIVVTYGDAFEFSRKPGQSWEKAFANRPRRIAVPPRRQGEAICYNQDGRSLCLTSEKKPAPVIMVPAVNRGPRQQKTLRNSPGRLAEITGGGPAEAGETDGPTLPSPGAGPEPSR